jgi:hypothetical protein
MLDEDIQLRAFQSLKIDRNHMKLNLNQLSSLNKLESVSKKPTNPKIKPSDFPLRQSFVFVLFVDSVIMYHH